MLLTTTQDLVLSCLSSTTHQLLMKAHCPGPLAYVHNFAKLASVLHLFELLDLLRIIRLAPPLLRRTATP